jgi:hypothetical protein
MSYKKFFKTVNSVLPANSREHELNSAKAPNNKYGNWLPEVYRGPTDRLQRYQVYDQMNLDHEISAALDTIADFGTEADPQTQRPFVVSYNDDPSPAEITVIEKALGQWVRLNELNKRTWKIFRSTLQYGDQFFIRDPETFKLYWIDQSKVDKVIVNESEGKKIESFWIKDIDLNVSSLVATNQLNKTSTAQYGTNSIMFSPPLSGGLGSGYASMGQGANSAYSNGSSTAVDAEHIVQVSMADGMTEAWPFGLSILETIYKVYKQKELLEDAILIYRIHRAPERRIFYIDVGTMPPNKSSQYLERVKYEVNQKRIPSRTGGGCFAMDTKVPLLDGRKLTLTELAEEYENGKKNWAYSCNPLTGEMAPGLITWAGVTQKSAQVIKLTLDNGEVIVCTPEHKFPVIGKGKIEAKDIVVGDDSLFSFNTRMYGIDGNDKGNKYHQTYNNLLNKWEFTHRRVAGFMKEINKHNELVYDDMHINSIRGVIHHANFNRFNNNPENLHYMNGHDHFLLHSTQYSKYYNALSKEEKDAIKNKFKETMAGKSKEELDAIQTARELTVSSKSADEKKLIADAISVGNKASWKKLKTEHPDEYVVVKERLVEHIKEIRKPWDNHTTQFNVRMFTILCDTVTMQSFTKKQLLENLSNNTEFMSIYAELNPENNNSVNKLRYDAFCMSALYKLINWAGYGTWRVFIKSLGKRQIQPTRRLVWDKSMLKMLVDLVKDKGIMYRKDAYTHIIAHSAFMEKYAFLNSRVHKHGKYLAFTPNTFIVFLQHFGFDTWQDFLNKIPQFNHKVVSIEYIDAPMEVGTLTIDGNEEYHDYHTFAIEQGVYTFNSNITDSTYSPLSTLDDYFFAVTSEGRGSKVEVLPGGDNLGDIDDLRYFNNKMMRALGVPSSYLPTGPEDGTATVNDGRVGTAFIQEFRFSKVVRRHQQQIEKAFDKEFKLFLKHRGVSLDNSLFQITLTEPQSFSEYRTLELDAAKVNITTALIDLPFVSKRFILKRYLGWTEQELSENERMWKEERSRLTKKFVTGPDGSSAPAQLSDVGITSSSIDNMPSDLGDDSDLNDSGETDTNTGPDVTDNEVDNFGQ